MSATGWNRVREEAVGYLRDLIRFDTSNPPGNELPAAIFLRDILQREGIEAQIFESAPSRANLIARLHGSGEARPMLLLSHLDVVPAKADEWYLPPFSGDIVDDHIWGRGAIDCKFLTIIQLMTILLLHRQCVSLKRDVIFAATADEEAGSKWGMGWLAVHHRDLLDCEYAINEGGGVGVAFGNKRYYICQTAEKGICWLRIRAKGKAGHASMPRDDNATAVLIRALEQLSRSRLEMRVTTTAKDFIETFAKEQGLHGFLLSRGLLNPRLFPVLLPRIIKEPTVARIVYAMLHDTATPTIIKSGEIINVIPSIAEAQIDGRIVPGQTQDGFVNQIRRVVGDSIEIEVPFYAPGFEIPHDNELFKVIRDVIAVEDPDARLVPFMLTAGTDSKYLAAAGVRVYGFAPMQQQADATVTEMIHGRDERIAVENVLFGTKVLYNIVKRFCA